MFYKTVAMSYSFVSCPPSSSKICNVVLIAPIIFQATAFHSLLPAVREKIVDGFTPEARDMFEREFEFFDKVTSISGVLFPLPKEERRAGIKRYKVKTTVMFH